MAAASLLLLAGSANAGQIGVGAFVTPTVEDFESLSLAFTNPTPLVLNGVTYNTDTGTYRYFPTGSSFPDCFSACISTDSDTGFIDVAFATPFTMAGAYVGADTSDWTATADFYDASNTWLGSVSLSSAAASNLFAGWESDAGISRIRFTDTSANFYVLTLDDVTRESPVPEPASLILLSTGVLGMAARRRRS
jgi:hypothetical protein